MAWDRFTTRPAWMRSPTAHRSSSCALRIAAKEAQAILAWTGTRACSAVTASKASSTIGGSARSSATTSTSTEVRPLSRSSASSLSSSCGSSSTSRLGARTSVEHLRMGRGHRYACMTSPGHPRRCASLVHSASYVISPKTSIPQTNAPTHPQAAAQ